jgi:hypothetical protein
MSPRKMSLRRWRDLRDEIAVQIEGILDNVGGLDDCTVSDKRYAAEKARDAVLKSLYETDAIQPPEGIDPS